MIVPFVDRDFHCIPNCQNPNGICSDECIVKATGIQMTTQAEGRLTKEQIEETWLWVKRLYEQSVANVYPAAYERLRAPFNLALRALSAPSEAREAALEAAKKACEYRQYNFVGGAPDWQGGCIACATDINALKRTAAPARVAEGITESQVSIAANIIASSPLIDAPKLPSVNWRGLARQILEAAAIPSADEVPAKEQPVAGRSYAHITGAAPGYTGEGVSELRAPSAVLKTQSTAAPQVQGEIPLSDIGNSAESAGAAPVEPTAGEVAEMVKRLKDEARAWQRPEERWIPVSERLPTTKEGEQEDVLFGDSAWGWPVLGMFTYWGKDQSPEFTWSEYDQLNDRYVEWESNRPTLWMLRPNLPPVPQYDEAPISARDNALVEGGPKEKKP